MRVATEIRRLGAEFSFAFRRAIAIIAAYRKGSWCRMRRLNEFAEVAMKRNKNAYLRAWGMACAIVIAGAAAEVRAQNYERPPVDIEDRGAIGEDPSASLRVDRLESQVRTLNGQVEQLQYQVKRMEDMLRKFQTDIDARFQEYGGGRPPQRRSELPDLSPAPQAAQIQPPALTPAPLAGDGRRRDAFDPSTQAAAPGAPKELGSPNSASKPLRADTRDPDEFPWTLTRGAPAMMRPRRPWLWSPRARRRPIR